MLSGLGSALGVATLGQGGGVSFASMYAAGEDGFLFANPLDLTRLFKDYAGAGNVAVDSDSVGLALDNHSWGDKTLAQVLATQPNIAPGDPSFDTSIAGYTLYTPGGLGTGGVSNVGGKLRIDIASGYDIGFQFTMNGLTVGRLYRVSFDRDPASTYTGPLYSPAGTGVGTQTGNSQVWYIYATAATMVFTFRTVFLGPYTGQFYSLDSLSVQLVPGNRAGQNGTSKCPLYKTNSGKPYLAHDGSDDALITPVLPAAALTLAVACRGSAVNTVAVGGGTIAGNKRCRIGLDGSGFATASWGGVAPANAVDMRGVDFVGLLVGDTASVDFYVDNVLVSSTPNPATSPNGGTGPFTLGANNDSGTPGLFWSGRVYAALELNRRATPAEIAFITSQFQRTYQ